MKISNYPKQSLTSNKNFNSYLKSSTITSKQDTLLKTQTTTNQTIQTTRQSNINEMRKSTGFGLFSKRTTLNLENIKEKYFSPKRKFTVVTNLTTNPNENEENIENKESNKSKEYKNSPYKIKGKRIKKYLPSINTFNDKAYYKTFYFKEIDIKHKNKFMMELKNKLTKIIKDKVIINIDKVITDLRLTNIHNESVKEKKYRNTFSAVNPNKKINFFGKSSPELIHDYNIYSSGFENKFYTPEEIILNNFTLEEIEYIRNYKQFFNLNSNIFNMKILTHKPLKDKLEEEEKLLKKNNLKKGKFISFNPYFKLKEKVKKKDYTYGKLEKFYEKIPEKKIVNYSREYKGEYNQSNPIIIPTINKFYDDDYSFDNEEDHTREKLLAKIFHGNSDTIKSNSIANNDDELNSVNFSKESKRKSSMVKFSVKGSR